MQAGGSSLIFLKLEGISGESTQANHKGEIELKSFSFHTSRSATLGSAGSGAGAGKVNVATFKLVKQVDSASPKLFLDVASGTHIKQAEIVVERSSKGKLTQLADYKLSEVLVNDIVDSFSSKPATESIDGVFQKITFTTFGGGTTGTGKTATSGWNLVTNKSL